MSGKDLGVVLHVDLVVVNHPVEVLECFGLGHVLDAKQSLASRLKSFVVRCRELLVGIELAYRPVVCTSFFENYCPRRTQTAGCSLCRKGNTAGSGADND